MMPRTALRALLAFVALAVASLAMPAAAEPSTAAAERQILVMVQHPPDHYRPNGAYGGGYGDELARSARQRLARRIAGDYGLELVDAWPMSMIGLDCFVMAVPDGRSTASAAEQVSHDAAVAWAEPVAIYHAQGAALPHRDPLFAAQPAARQWRLAELHRLATGRGVRVAVIDSAVDATHPDLAGQVALSRNFVAGRPASAEAHGTGVAGIIAAKADNGIGIAGVAPGARLLALRSCWTAAPGRTLCDSFSLVKALYYAIQQKPDVINLSLSGPNDRLLDQLVKLALARGSVVVAAFDGGRPDGGFPASVEGVIPVADASLARSRSRVYIAPGRDVPTTEPGGRWFLVNGSSYSAAHVSGLVALLRQDRRSAAPALVTEGSGTVIDACSSLLRAVRRCDCTCDAPRVASAKARP
jgi:subtilisin family serine protease